MAALDTLLPWSRRIGNVGGNNHGPAVRCNAEVQAEGMRGPMPDGSQVGRSASTTLLTLPNVITFARLCAVPLSVWLVMEHRFAQAFFLFLAAGLSDAVDGWLARRNGGGNAVGALLDPVADKALAGDDVCDPRGGEGAAGLAGHPGGVPRCGDRGRRRGAVPARPLRADPPALCLEA